MYVCVSVYVPNVMKIKQVIWEIYIGKVGNSLTKHYSRASIVFEGERQFPNSYRSQSDVPGRVRVPVEQIVNYRFRANRRNPRRGR